MTTEMSIDEIDRMLKKYEYKIAVLTAARKMLVTYQLKETSDEKITNADRDKKLSV